jgi:uridine phosphorylase
VIALFSTFAEKNMPNLSEPDLIVNDNGSVYHICMRPEDLADTVIVVGDPQRVSEISGHFTGIDHRASNREFISHTGYFNGKRITALSTGIGTDNCDIVMHELDALANFNLKTRTQNQFHRPLTIIRLGTSGTIQPDVPVNSFVLSTHAVGLDNLIYFYKGSKEIIDAGLTGAFSAYANWPEELSAPYFIRGSERLINLLSPISIPGITVTAPGFYGPQGRFLRLPLTDPDMVAKLQDFRHDGLRIVNFEMETSAIYGLGGLMGHEAITVCAVIANRATGEYNPDHKTEVNRLIEMVLETITQ